MPDESNVTSILFVCHGNICRSPMAEFVMKDLVKRRGLSDSFRIESCATSREEIGNDVYPPARRELEKHGVPCGHRGARQMTSADYDRYDYIVAMDRNNLRNMERFTNGDPQNKVRLLMSYAGREQDVADPWYTGDFSGTYEDVLEGCEALLDLILGSE